jgi:hypothetical protein
MKQRKLSRQERKMLLQVLDGMERKKQTLKEAIADLELQVRGLQEIRDLVEQGGKEIGGVEIKLEKSMTAEKLTGLWIVSENNGSDVTLKHFYSLVRGKDEVPYTTLTLEGIMHKNHIGDDGKEVTFKVGDMLAVAQFDQDNMKFHFANVGPSGEQGQFQLALALSKLNLGTTPNLKGKESFLVTDGLFRRIN